jgi:putative lipoprotein
VRILGIITALLIGLLLFTGCARPATVKGTVNTQEQVELPSGAVVNVQLQDTSRADAPAVVLGEQVIQNTVQFPVPFEIAYDPTQIDEQHVYSMRVRIEVEGKLIFINTTSHHVSTRGFPTELEVIVEKVATGSPPGTAAALEDTMWTLMSYGESGSLQAVLADTEITVEFVSAEGSVRGSSGCNSYGGGYEIDQDKLLLPGPLMGTAMACPEPIMKQEMEYLKALQEAQSFQIQDRQLTITSAGNQILVFGAP